MALCQPALSTDNLTLDLGFALRNPLFKDEGFGGRGPFDAAADEAPGSSAVMLCISLVDTCSSFNEPVILNGFAFAIGAWRRAEI